MSDVLGWIYTEHGAAALIDAQLYAAKRGPWGQWFLAERELPAKERLEGFTYLLCVGSFSEIKVVEEHDRWIVRTDVCGTCGRQLRDRYDADAFSWPPSLGQAPPRWQSQP